MKILTSAVIGLLIALPPFIVDAKMRSFFSNKKGTIESIVALGQSWPVDNLRLNRIIISLGDNNLNDDARELASFSALKFPNDYVLVPLSVLIALFKALPGKATPRAQLRYYVYKGLECSNCSSLFMSVVPYRQIGY